MDDERPRDVRDSLSELEQRLLELELELRADSLSDASAARQTTPGGLSASTSVVEAQAVLAQPTTEATYDAPAPEGRGTARGLGDTPIADEVPRTGAAQQAVQAKPAPPAEPPAPPAGPPAPPEPPAQPDVRPFVDDTRRKVDALRTSLDGLTVASDRLREVAQVVVEDHGRALVRLERANAARQAAAPKVTLPAPAIPGASAPPPTVAPAAAREPRRPAAPVTARPPERPVAHTPEPLTADKPLPGADRPDPAGGGPARDAAPAQATTPPPKTPPADTPAQATTPPPKTPPADTPAQATTPAVKPSAPLQPPDPLFAPRKPTPASDDGLSLRDRRRWLLTGLAALVASGVSVTFVAINERGDSVKKPPTVPGSISRIALTPELGPDARAFTSVPGTRPASDAGAVSDLCDGVVGAAVVIRASGADAVPPCLNVVTVTSGTVSALALSEPRSKSKRTCVAAGDVPSIAASRADRRRTAARDASVQRATTSAERATRDAPLPAGERAGRVHTAAFEAGRAFDSRERLRLLAVRAVEQAGCVVPGRDDVASGRYPLSSRIELLALEATRDLPGVERAAAVIEHLTSGPAPISATVLRRER